MMTMSHSSLPLSLADIVIQHFDAHQKGVVADAGRKKKSIVTNSVQSRAELLWQDVSKRKGNAELVESSVFQCVKAALVAASSSLSDDEAIDRILSLAAVFCFKFDPSCYNELWSIAVQASQSTIEPLRTKGCFLMGRCLESISDSQEEDILAEYCKLAEKALAPRLVDRSHLVRCGAIHACQHCFFNERCWPAKIEEGLIVVMTHDTSFANRMAAVNGIPITEDTIPFIIERTRDVKPKVRESALITLKTKVDFDMLNDHQRNEILLSGLTERCPTTYEATAKLLCCGWMKRFKFDPLQLLRNLILVENELACEKSIKAIIHAAEDSSKGVLAELSAAEREAFKENVQAASKDIKSQLLDPAMALYLQVHFSIIIDSNTLSSSQKSEKISQILPDLATLCDVLQIQLEKHGRARMNGDADDDTVAKLESHACFICSQLLTLAQKADIQEEAGLRRLASLIHNMLCSSETPEDLIEPSVQTLSFIQSSEADFIRCVSEAVLEVGCSTMCTNVEEKTSRQMRTLSILSIAMENIALTREQKVILQGFPETILPCVTSENASVRQAAVSCLGKYSLFADRLLFSPLLFEITKNERETIEVRAQALLALCDLSLLAGTEHDDTSAEVGSILLEFFNHDEMALVIVAAEVCVKLLLSGRLQNEEILAQLIGIFFRVCGTVEDADEDEACEVGSPRRIQQILSLFFPAYCICNENNRILLLQSIRTLITKSINVSNDPGKKKKSSTLASSIPRMIDYICDTVDIACSTNQGNIDESEEEKNANAPEGSLADYLTELYAAVSVSQALLENEEMSAPNLRMLCKIFASLAETIEFDTAKDSCSLRKQASLLKHNWEELEVRVSDHYASASLEKLRDVIGHIEDNDSDGEQGHLISNKISVDSEDLQEE